jgi:hypothetical protein
MKTRIKIAVLALLLTAGITIKAQDYKKEYLGLPGDNLNLYAVMNIFQESKNLRAFERNLNDPEKRINNLDLNGDNLVDYLTVSDIVNGDVHYIVLRVALNRKESQDVAVFTIQQFNNGEVYVQLTGDEALYGKNYIIEPAGQVLLADWPAIRYMYRPNYIGWQSEWYWGYYPDYWTPWRPFYWHYYYGYNYYWNEYYYTCYHRSYAHRDPYWNEHYYNGHRVYSQEVTHNVNAGNYRSTYSHPEKMKEGEEQYMNRYPETGRRSTYSTSTDNTSIRNNNSIVTSRRSSGIVTTNRNNDETYNGNSEREYRILKDENATRRVASEATRNTFNNSAPDRRTVSDNRSSAQLPERSAPRPEQNRNISPSRPSEQVSARPASRPEQGQSVSGTRSSGQSRTESVSPARRSGVEEKQVKNTESSEKERKPESSSASRRK